MKLKNEAGDVILEGEIKISEFYKKEFGDLKKVYDESKRLLKSKGIDNEILVII